MLSGRGMDHARILKTSKIRHRSNHLRCLDYTEIRSISVPAKYSEEKRLEMFWSRVDKSKYCWEWTGSRNNKSPYGAVRWNGPIRFTHVVSWELHFGPIPEGLKVLHKCDNPPCTRPDHLFLGTQQENVLDAVRKGRWPARGGRHPKATCYLGHLMRRDCSNHSYCPDCTRARARKYYRAKFGERGKSR